MFTPNSHLGNPFHVFTDASENPSSSTQQDHTSPFLNFPEHFLAEYDNEFFLTNILSLQPQIMNTAATDPPEEAEEEEEEQDPLDGDIKISSPEKAAKEATSNQKKKGTRNGEKQAIPRKRTGKKDRHSKIYTSQGPRDRRMRLSLQIARKFFDLQDMLGFDKASKTIEWLFSKSRAAIKELSESLPRVEHSCSGKSLKSLSPTSESEVVSGIKENEHNGNHRKTRSKAVINPVAKESRDKARARARERTKEKMKMRGADEEKHEDSEPLGSSSPLQNAAEKLNPTVKEMDSVSIIEKFLGMNTSTPSFNYLHNVADSSDAYSRQDDAVSAENWDHGYTRNDRLLNSQYHGVQGMKGSTGNYNMFQEQNPNGMFLLNPSDQEHKSSSSIFSDASEVNTNSFIMASSNVLEQNHSSVLNPHSHFIENQFSYGGSFIANKSSTFY